MSLIIKLFFILSLFFVLPVKAEVDVKKIELFTSDTLKLDIKNINKSSVVKSYVANVKLNPDSIEILAKSQGTTYIYLWGKTLQVLLLNVNIKNIPQTNKSNSSSSFKTNEPYGRYNLNTSPNLGKLSDEVTLGHSFSYKMPLLNGHLNLNTSATTINKLSEVLEFSIQNININFKNKNFLIEMGDINSGFLNNSSLKGLGANYFFPEGNLTFLGGLSKSSSKLNIFSKKNTNSDLNSGFALYLGGQYRFNNNLEFESDFFSLNRFSDNSKNFGMNFNFKYKPFENLNLSNRLKTDFKNLLWSYNINSNYKFPVTNETIESNLSVSNEYNDKILSNSNYALNLRLKHRSDIVINNSFIYSRNLYSEQQNYSLRLSRDIYKDVIDLYTQFDLRNSTELSKNFQIGSNFKYNLLLPINLSYNFNYIANNKTSAINDFSLKLDLVDNSFIQSSLNNIFNLNYSEKNSLSNNLMLNSKFNFHENFNTNVQLSYQYNIENTSKVMGVHKLNAKISNSLKLFDNNEIKFSVNANNENLLKNNFNINSNINYIYNFGVESKNTGKITGTVFDDKNCNSILDEDESPVVGVKVFLKDKTSITDSKGNYEFLNLEYGKYQVKMGTEGLKKGYKMTTSLIEEVNLDKSNYNFNFGITNKITLKGYVYSSKTKNKGLANIEVKLDNDSSLTDDDGAFYFKSIPGLHVLEIEHTTIPKNYKFQGKLNQKIELSEEKDNNIEFIFKPKRTIKLSVHKSSDTSKVLSGIEVIVKHKPINSDSEHIEKIKTDEDGEVILTDIEEGEVEIYSKFFKDIYKIEVPDDPINKIIKVSI
jgi:hypothetical protein